jgi:hypothetical protein
LGQPIGLLELLADALGYRHKVVNWEIIEV